MAARSRTIEFRGVFEGKYKAEKYTPPGPITTFPRWKIGDVWFTINVLGCTIRGFPTPWTFTHTRQYNVSVQMPAGGTNGSDFTVLSFPTNGAQTIDFTGGFWRVTAEVEEDVSNTGTGQFPNYGGVRVPDGAHELRQVRRERLKVGSTLLAEIDAGGLTATGTLLITPSNAGLIDHFVAGTFEGQAWNEDALIASSALFDWGGGTIALSAPFDVTSVYGHHAHANAVGADAPSGPTPEGFALRVVTSYSLYPARKWAFYPRVRAMEQAYPGPVAFQVDRHRLDLAKEVIVAGDGSLADSYSQRRYNAGASFWLAPFIPEDTTGPPQPRAWSQLGVEQPTGVGLNEWQPFRCWIPNSWLVAQGEEQRDWRTQVLETPFPAYSAEHQSSYAAEDGSGDWTNVANVPTPSNAGGYVVLAVSGGTGSAERTFDLAGRENTISPADDWESFRSLEIELQADGASKPFTLSVAGKMWSGTTGATPNTDSVVTFDLQAPHNASSPTDGTDSRWPLNVSPGDYFGVVKAVKMTLSGLSDGVTYRINRITLVRSSRAKVTHALAFERWAPNSVGSDYNRHVTGEVDGGVGLEVAGMTRTPVGSDFSYLWPSIAQCVATINSRPGWSAALAGSFPDSQHDSLLPLMYCGGKDGGYYQESSGGWHDSVDETAAALLAVVACPQFDEVDWYPACGDLQSLAYGEVTPMRVYKTLRGEAWGVVIDNTAHAGSAGESVAISGGASADETVVTDSLGHFRSSPRKAATVSVMVGAANLSRVVRNRYRVYGGFGAVGATESDGLSVDISRGQRLVRAYRLEGTVRLAFAQDALWTQFVERDTGIFGKPTEVRFERSGRRNLLYLAYIDSSNAHWLLASANEGESWEMAVSLASGVTQNALCVGTNHLSYSYWRTSGGAIRGKIVNSLGTLVHPVDDPANGFEVVASGVDDKDITCACTPGGGGTFQIVLDYYASGTLTQVRSTDGVHFS